MKKGVFTLSIILYILLTHLAGFFGLIHPSTRNLFIFLTPIHLWGMFLVSILVSNYKDKKFLFTVLYLLIASFIVEFLGVKTKILFGDYDYKHTSLGLEFLEVPLVIGPNWVALVLSSSSLTEFIFGKRSVPFYLKTMVSALFMVFLDFLMEPVAVYFHYWHWNPGPAIPFQNYLAWFVFSWVCHSFYQSRLPIFKNISLQVLYISQVIFFLALNYYIGNFTF